MLGNRGLHLHSVGRCEHKIPYRIDQAREIWPMFGGISKTRALYVRIGHSHVLRMYLIRRKDELCLVTTQDHSRSSSAFLLSWTLAVSSLFSSLTVTYIYSAVSARPKEAQRLKYNHSPRTTKASPETPM